MSNTEIKNRVERTLARLTAESNSMRVTKVVSADEQGDVAQTILAQIRAADRWALGAWGAHQIQLREFEHAVKFKVRGAKFRGWVYIRLMPSDTYTVQTARLDASTGYEWKVIEEFDDIYCDQLVPVLDSMIEGRRS